jgi:CBS domain-containing protein
MDPHQRRVSEIMRTEVATLAPQERLDLADDIMKLGRVRHMPVLEDGRLVGLVSQRDLLAASLTGVLDFDKRERRTFMRSVKVSEVMSHGPIGVEPEATLREAAELLVHHRIGCLPVLNSDGTLVGLVTETDLLRAGFLGEDESSEKEQEVRSVTDLGARLGEDLEALKRARDELRVRVHLGAAEAKDLWERMEKKWHEFEAKAKFVSKEAEEPLRDVGQAAKQLLGEIREGYRKIRQSL